MAALLVSLPIMLGVISVAGGPWWWLLLAPVLAVIAIAQTGVALRLARCPAGVVELHADRLVVNDASVFREPVTIHRSEIAAIEDSPQGAFAVRVGGPAAKKDAALLSLMPEKPNILVRFSRPTPTPSARHNEGLKSSYALRSPHRTKPTNGFWLRTAEPAGADQIKAWFTQATPPRT